MTEKRKKKITLPFRKGAREDQIIRWTRKRDVFDRLDTGISEIVKDHSDLDRILAEGYRTMAVEDRETAEQFLGAWGPKL